MFTVESFLNDDYRADYTEEKIGSQKFTLRRLNGFERLEFLDYTKFSERVVFALAHGLLDGKTKQPIGEENAKKFVERYDALSEAVASRILSITTDATNAEKEQWGLAEKNLKETSSSDSIGNTATATD